jgi:hypothetical protein
MPLKPINYLLEDGKTTSLEKKQYYESYLDCGILTG